MTDFVLDFPESFFERFPFFEDFSSNGFTVELPFLDLLVFDLESVSLLLSLDFVFLDADDSLAITSPVFESFEFLDLVDFVTLEVSVTFELLNCLLLLLDTSSPFPPPLPINNITSSCSEAGEDGSVCPVFVLLLDFALLFDLEADDAFEALVDLAVSDFGRVWRCTTWLPATNRAAELT